MTRHARSLLLVVLIVALFAGLGCSWLRQQGTPSPEQQQAQLRELHDYARTADALVSAARSLQDAEIAVYDLRTPDGGRYISPAQHRTIQEAFRVFFAETAAAAERAKDLTLPESDRRALVRTLYDGVTDLLTRTGALSEQLAPTVAAVRVLVDALLAASGA